MVRPLRPLAVDDDAGSAPEAAAGSADIPALAGPRRQFATAADAGLARCGIAPHPIGRGGFQRRLCQGAFSGSATCRTGKMKRPWPHFPWTKVIHGALR
jgi:hypothetical protein